MTTNTNPVTGNFTGGSGSMGGGVPNLTRAQYVLAAISDSIATDIVRETERKRGYFTAFDLKQKPVALDPLVANGILTIHKSTKHDGHYYKTTSLTRAWCLTSLALADERATAMQKRTSGG